MQDIATEKNSTIILPIPIEFMEYIKEKKNSRS